MPKYIEPFKLPFPREVKPVTELRLDDSELYLFDSAAEELTTIAGTDVTYWCANAAKTRKDPLYGESIGPVFGGPYKIRGFVTDVVMAPEANERGFRKVYTASLWLCRVLLEQAKMSIPTEGDVCLVWDIPFYGEYGEPEPLERPSKFYFDVTSVNTDGYPFDQPGFVGFKAELKRRSEFTPDRRFVAK